MTTVNKSLREGSGSQHPGTLESYPTKGRLKPTQAPPEVSFAEEKKPLPPSSLVRGFKRNNLALMNTESLG